MKLFENIKDFFFAAEDEDGDCIITPNGQKYHNIYGCVYLSKSKRIKKVASEDAEAAGLEPCSKCW